MKRLLLSGLMGVILLPEAGVAVDDFYINNGSVNNPQVDAINVVNKGLWQASGTLIYETFDTLNFTNQIGTYSSSGVMDGTPGFRFMTSSTTTGLRTMASSFFNDNGAVVRARDSSAFGFPCAVATVDPSYLLISATNIVVKGGTSGSPKASLLVGANGLLELTGQNVDLTRSGLAVLPVWAEARGSANGDTNFMPDIAISDQYWARTNFTEQEPLFSGSLWNGSTAWNPDFTLPGPYADSYLNDLGSMTVTVTNQSGSPQDVVIITNMAKGAVFILGPTGFGVQAGFSQAQNGSDTVGVLLSAQFTNVATARPEDAYLYLEDRLASGGTTGLLQNLIGCPANTFRPANYLLTRFPFDPGAAGNWGYPERAFFTKSGNTDPLVKRDGVTNTVVAAGEWSDYGAYVDNTASRPPSVAGASVTNVPGRISITADRLDLTRTRLRAEGQIFIKTSHLISSSNAVVDCQNLNFDLASTNGNLNVQNLSMDGVNRLTGSISVWSAVWSNTAEVVLESYVVDDEGNATPADITNSVNIVFHTLMVDGRSLSSFLPVSVFSVTTRSTNVVVKDNMSLGQSAVFDCRSLTLEGNISIPGNPLRDWTYVNVPNLLYFTNHGTFSIANESHFGDDRAAPYSTFVNTGTINAASIALKSVYFENRGTLASDGPLFMQCGSAKLENGSSTSGGDSQFLSGSLKFNNYQMTVNGGLYLRATNALFDAGGSSANTFTVQNGFSLQIKPQTGDLLGTTLRTTAPSVPSVAIDHVWAGADRGATPAGYSNNVALGSLVLRSQSPDPWFYFTGTDAQNGLYVDLLDLSAVSTNLQSLQSKVAIDPSLVIYFAAAKLGFTPPASSNGIPVLPEEYLDGMFEGRLRWVRDFAGPNSYMDVLINGRTAQVNRALRNSRLIDSNGNGIPNFYDADPFGNGLTLVASLVPANPAPASAVAVSWTALPNRVYRIEYSTDPLSNDWQLLGKYTNTAATNRMATVVDPNAPAGGARRFYRVGYAP